MRRSDISDVAIVDAYFRWRTEGYRSAYELLGEQFPDAAPKVIDVAVARARNRGLVEYGVGVHLGWITEKGAALLLGK